MKHIIIILTCVLMSVLASTEALAQSKWEGNCLVQQTSKSREKMVLTKTSYTIKNSKGDIYTVYINLKTGRCYTKRVSKKTGIERNQPLNEEDSKEICKKLNVPYTYKSKKK